MADHSLSREADLFLEKNDHLITLSHVSKALRDASLPLCPSSLTSHCLLNAPHPVAHSITQSNAAPCALPLPRIRFLLKAPGKALRPPRGGHQLLQSHRSPEVIMTAFGTSPATPAGAPKYLTGCEYVCVCQVLQGRKGAIEKGLREQALKTGHLDLCHSCIWDPAPLDKSVNLLAPRAHRMVSSTW